MFFYLGMDTPLLFRFPFRTSFEPPVAMAEQNRRLTETITRERGRLGGSIRQRVPDSGEAEDILQDVFFELVEAEPSRRSARRVIESPR